MFCHLFETFKAKADKMTTILTLPEVLARTKISRATLYQLLDAGDFPRPFKIGARKNGWTEARVEDWIASRDAAAKDEIGAKA